MNDNSQNFDHESKLPAVKTPLRAGANVAPIVPRTYEEAWRIATHYVKTGMAPRDMKTTERVMIALMAGMEVGLPPIAALNGIAIINNRPRIWGAAVPALAINTGQLVAWDETIEGEGDAMMARCLIARRISADLVIRKEASFSVVDARQAGLWDERPTVERWMTNYQTNQKEKKTVPNDSPWYRYRKRMMTMRARQVFTDLFADVLCGLGIAEVYVDANTDAEMRDVTPPVQPIIHNPLQDDADERHPVPDIAVGDIVTGGPFGEEGARIVGQFVPNANHDPITGEVFDAKADSERRDAEDPPSPPEMPRQPRTEAAGEPKDETVPKQPATEKTNHGANGALGVTFGKQKEWVTKGPADYERYLWQWTEAWVAWGQDPNGLRDRYAAERNIRNALGTPMDDKQLQMCKAIAAGAFRKLGGVAK